MNRPGALVISLDFELHWGVRDHAPASAPYRENLIGARRAIPDMLKLFVEAGVAATWATVGLLFARSRQEASQFAPAVRPAYLDVRLDPFREQVGENESDDSLHYAPSLVAAIAAAPRQEIASHTYSHYYTAADGQTAEAFEADLRSAVAIAAARNVRLRSIVFPRNQVRTDYLAIARRVGFDCFRGNRDAWPHRDGDGPHIGLFHRAVRFADLHVPLTGSATVPWSDVRPIEGMVNVPASLFLRPSVSRRSLSTLVRARRLRDLIARAAAHGEIAHLWWHPHNFGRHLDDNLALLSGILEAWQRGRAEHGMLSLSMCEAADMSAQR